MVVTVVALCLVGIGLIAGRFGHRALGSRSKAVLVVIAGFAAATSAAYVELVLGGGPRIIDATSYDLAARALAEGYVAFPVVDPAPSVWGRFLLARLEDGAPVAAVIFPPGYPTVLAIGHALGAPMAVGPVLAALLVLATYRLVRAFARGPRGRIAALLAASLSAASFALRYHTADTMSHGLSALCVAGALLFVRQGRAGSRTWQNGLGGLSLGWLIATRPLSGIACALALLPELLRGRGRLRRILGVVAGSVPGVGWLLVHQRLATGSWASSSQAAYYAQADGPPGCFRLGFGEGIGCREEHGDFVRANLEQGYGAWEALLTTGRRLKMHAIDAGNSELFAVVLVLALIAVFSSARFGLLARACFAQIALYALFYFDGNYPGGGGRFFVDVIAVEHALIALWLVGPLRRNGWTKLPPVRVAAFALGLVWIGGAARAAPDHAQLKGREGGAPMYRADEAPVAGLVFVTTDHGFNLGHDPATALSPHPDAPVVLRYRGDAIDELAWSARGEPQAFIARYDFDTGALAFEPYRPHDSGVLEGESLAPPLTQHGGWVARRFAGGTCASGGQYLAHLPVDEPPRGTVQLAIPDGWLEQRFRPRLIAWGGPLPSFELELRAKDESVTTWQTSDFAEDDAGGDATGKAARCLVATRASTPIEDAKNASLLLRFSSPHGIDPPNSAEIGLDALVRDPADLARP